MGAGSSSAKKKQQASQQPANPPPAPVPSAPPPAAAAPAAQLSFKNAAPAPIVPSTHDPLDLTNKKDDETEEEEEGSTEWETDTDVTEEEGEEEDGEEDEEEAAGEQAKPGVNEGEAKPAEGGEEKRDGSGQPDAEEEVVQPAAHFGGGAVGEIGGDGTVAREESASVSVGVTEGEAERVGEQEEEGLLEACRDGKLERVQLEVQRGTNLSVVRDVQSNGCLHYAALHAHREVVLELLDAGCTPLLPNSDKNLPIHYAIASGSRPVAEALLSREAQPQLAFANKDGFMPCHLAALEGKGAGGSESLLAQVLPRGAEGLAARTEGGLHLLHLASLSGDVATVTTVLELAAATDGEPRRLSTVQGQGGGEAVKGLLNGQDTAGDAPLHLLASGGMRNAEDITALLLQAGADPTARNAKQQTPLMIANAHHRTAIAALLAAPPSLVSSVLPRPTSLVAPHSRLHPSASAPNLHSASQPPPPSRGPSLPYPSAPAPPPPDSRSSTIAAPPLRAPSFRSAASGGSFRAAGGALHGTSPQRLPSLTESAAGGGASLVLRLKGTAPSLFDPDAPLGAPSHAAPRDYPPPGRTPPSKPLRPLSPPPSSSAATAIAAPPPQGSSQHLLPGHAPPPHTVLRSKKSAAAATSLALEASRDGSAADFALSFSALAPPRRGHTRHTDDPASLNPASPRAAAAGLAATAPAGMWHSQEGGQLFNFAPDNTLPPQHALPNGGGSVNGAWAQGSAGFTPLPHQPPALHQQHQHQHQHQQQQFPSMDAPAVLPAAQSAYSTPSKGPPGYFSDEQWRRGGGGGPLGVGGWVGEGHRPRYSGGMAQSASSPQGAGLGFGLDSTAAHWNQPIGVEAGRLRNTLRTQARLARSAGAGLVDLLEGLEGGEDRLRGEAATLREEVEREVEALHAMIHQKKETLLHMVDQEEKGRLRSVAAHREEFQRQLQTVQRTLDDVEQALAVEHPDEFVSYVRMGDLKSNLKRLAQQQVPEEPAGLSRSLALSIDTSSLRGAIARMHLTHADGPEAPRGMACTELTDCNAALSWKHADNALKYIVQMAQGGVGADPGEEAYEDVYEGNGCAHVVWGLGGNQSYFFRIKSVADNNASSNWSIPLKVTTPPESGHAWNARSSHRGVVVSPDGLSVQRAPSVAASWVGALTMKPLHRNRRFFTVQVHGDSPYMYVGIAYEGASNAEPTGTRTVLWRKGSGEVYLHGIKLPRNKFLPAPGRGSREREAQGFKSGDTVGVLVDFEQAKLSFYCNGILDRTVAGVNTSETLYGMVSIGAGGLSASIVHGGLEPTLPY